MRNRIFAYAKTKAHIICVVTVQLISTFFRYIDRTIPLLSNSKNVKSLAIFCGCTVRFVWDLVGNPEDRFSHNEAHFRHCDIVFLRRFLRLHTELIRQCERCRWTTTPIETVPIFWSNTNWTGGKG